MKRKAASGCRLTVCSSRGVDPTSRESASGRSGANRRAGRPALRRAAAGLALALLAAAAPGAGAARAGTACFLAVDLASGAVLAEHAAPATACITRAPPNSTFKVALALMGFEAGLLQDADAPVFTPPPGADLSRPQTRGPQTPASWMRHSVVWVSQVLARELGPAKLAADLARLDYGNRDMSGVAGEGDPLIRFWLSSSLRISAREQVDFLSRMLEGALPVAPAAVASTIGLMATDSPFPGWALFGKTGTGSRRHADGRLDPERPFGWFIGFARKSGRTVVFARFLALDERSAEPLGPLARRQALEALRGLLASGK